MNRLLAALLISVALASAGPLDTHLDPGTITAFETYTASVEQQLARRWSLPDNGLVIQSDPKNLQKVLAGEIVVHPSIARTPVEIDKGLVHDWIGSVFIPNTTVSAVLKLLQDFDHDVDIFPEMVRSHLISRDGNHLVGYWRVERKTGMLDIVLDVDNDTTYRQMAPGRWICISRASKIQQVEDAGKPSEKKLPVGEGYGFLWRMNNYWTFQSLNNGVLIECRNVSLSREVPGAVGWMVNPIVKEQPKISLNSTLEQTRKAVESDTRR